MKTTDYLNTTFVQQIMQDQFPDQTIAVQDITLLDVDNSASILVALTATQTESTIGHFGLEVNYTLNGLPQSKRMVMKIKPHGQEIVNMLNMLSQLCGGELNSVYEQFKHLTGFYYTHLKEQEIYKKLHPLFTPVIYGLYTNKQENIYIILMEYLDDVDLLNTVMAPEKWSDQHIKSALKQMAAWHSKMLNKVENVDLEIWKDAPSLQQMTDLLPLWNALLNNAADKFPELYDPLRVKTMRNAIQEIPNYWQQLEKLPKTLVHNDFNPRNSCFKTQNGEIEFCLYDWELATFHIPQYDLAEFLCFILDQDRYDQRYAYTEYYREELARLTGKYNSAPSFHQELYMATLDFGIHRVGLYMMGHSVSPYPFLPRVVNSFFDAISGHSLN